MSDKGRDKFVAAVQTFSGVFMIGTVNMDAPLWIWFVTVFSGAVFIFCAEANR